jgi:hypothetical protein
MRIPLGRVVSAVVLAGGKVKLILAAIAEC